MLKLKEEIYMDEVEDALVLLDTKKERVVVLQPEEKILLQSLLEMEVEDVVNRMLELYSGDKEKIKSDVLRFREKVLNADFAENV